MSFAELLLTLQLLPRPDKLRAMQFLSAELAREERKAIIEVGESYPVWSPFDAHDAAAILLQVLQDKSDES
jgi:hypothetical protein